MAFLAKLVIAWLWVMAGVVSIPSMAAILGEAEIRSYLGEPLRVRVNVSASEGEELSSSCFSIGMESMPSTLARDLRITFNDTGIGTSLTAQGVAGFNEPFAVVVVRSRCTGQGLVSREYTFLLDPRPAIEAPAAAVAIANANARVASTSTTATAATPPTSSSTTRPPGQWQAYPQDTLTNIAEGVYPGSIKRKARYIAALRQLNPELGNLADNAPLPAGARLILPDLNALSTTREVKPTLPVNSVVPATVSSQPLAVKPPRRASVANQDRASSAPVTKDTVALPKKSKSPRTQTNKKTVGEEKFQLRLSGGSVDTARSQSISEEERAQLREKQLLLETDDQVAQFLALKNTVKQMETRLNELQLRLSTLTPATATTTTAASPNASAALPTSTASIAPATGNATTAAATTPSPAPATPSANDALSQPSSLSTMLQRVPASWLIGIVVGLLIVAAALTLLFVWFGRLREKRLANAESSNHLDLSANFSQWANEVAVRDAERSPTPLSPLPTPSPLTVEETAALEVAHAQALADDEALKLRAAMRAAASAADKPTSPAPTKNAAYAPAANVTVLPVTSIRNHASDAIATVKLERPVFFDMLSSDDSATRFDLDDKPASNVDFPLDDLGEASEHHAPKQDELRMQRLKYMHERYPELVTNTVTLDDPSSIINAARLYFEESETAKSHISGREKACDLLTFAIEERPQQMRYWLAQFEIYRIDGMHAEYSAQAEKFHFLFAQSNAWPLVASIGNSMDATNPLFAKRKDHVDVDPTTLNWLNAPGDESIGALAAAFRLAVMSTHSITDADLVHYLADDVVQMRAVR